MLRKIRFLIASGPTRERLDPVRFISNYSTGAMGKYLVEAARKKGHRVEWVRCPEDTEAAAGLLKKLRGSVKNCDSFLMAAAVCDVKPARVSASKIKKDSLHEVRLRKNPDILAELAKSKKSGQVFVGFALESDKMIERGRAKLKDKRLDLLLVQKVSRLSNPFGNRLVDAVLLDKRGKAERLGKVGKDRVAGLLVRRVEKLFKEKSLIRV